MDKIAKFYKVSEKQFEMDWKNIWPGVPLSVIEGIYEGISLPQRATTGSAGYDFFAPASFTLKPGEEIKIPTGIRVHMQEGWVLCCYPRSSLGFKYRMQLNNTVGIIDSDYFASDNEGHIMAKFTNATVSGEVLIVESGAAFMQGIFMPFGITEDDNTAARRNGGFGSTDN